MAVRARVQSNDMRPSGDLQLKQARCWIADGQSVGRSVDGVEYSEKSLSVALCLHVVAQSPCSVYKSRPAMDRVGHVQHAVACMARRVMHAPTDRPTDERYEVLLLALRTKSRPVFPIFVQAIDDCCGPFVSRLRQV